MSEFNLTEQRSCWAATIHKTRLIQTILPDKHWPLEHQAAHQAVQANRFKKMQKCMHSGWSICAVGIVANKVIHLNLCRCSSIGDTSFDYNLQHLRISNYYAGNTTIAPLVSIPMALAAQSLRLSWQNCLQ